MGEMRLHSIDKSFLLATALLVVAGFFIFPRTGQRESVKIQPFER